MSEQVIVAIISTIGAITATLLTVKYKDRIVKKAEKPKDRMETIFDGYEKLIKQQQEEINRKGQNIAQLDSIIQRLEQELTETRNLLNITKGELEQSKQQNQLLTKQLAAMKLEYNEVK